MQRRLLRTNLWRLYKLNFWNSLHWDSQWSFWHEGHLSSFLSSELLSCFCCWLCPWPCAANDLASLFCFQLLFWLNGFWSPWTLPKIGWLETLDFASTKFVMSCRLGSLPSFWALCPRRHATSILAGKVIYQLFFSNFLGFQGGSSSQFLSTCSYSW